MQRFSIHIIGVLKRFIYYLRIWWLMSRNAFLSVFYVKLALLIFLSGKLIRFFFFLVFIFLLLNGLVIAAAFHILVLSFGILTLEIDHTIMIYRDFVNLGKLPVDIYKEPVKGILTFIFPVAIMTTLPAKYLMGLVTYRGVLISLSIGVLLTLISFKVWNHALKSYSSASS